MTSFLIWWHRVVLRHEQQTVMNGETEAGVQCWRPAPQVMMFHTRCRWFASDGGNGR